MMALAWHFLDFFRRPAVIVFLISALTKALFGLAVVANSERIISDPDSIGYFQLAENLRHHGIFSRNEQPPFALDSVLTPVYPVFLAVLLTLARGSLWIVPIAQGLINSLASVLVFKIGERLFGMRAGFVAGLCYGLDPSALVHTFSMLTESLFTFLFLAANCFLGRYVQRPSRRDLIASALLFGLSTLCRPVSLYYGIAVAAILLFVDSQTFKIRAGHAIIFFIIFIFMISPWMIRNRLTFGAAQLTSIQGINLLLINAAYLKAAQENLDYATAEHLLEAEADSLLAAKGLSGEKIKLEYRGRQYGYQINDPLQARLYQELAVEKILASPLLYARVHLMGVIPSLFDTSVRDIYHFAGKERPLLGLRALLVTEGLSSAWQKFWSRVEASYLALYLFNLAWLIMNYTFAFIAIYRLVKEKSFAPMWLLLLPILYLLLVTAPAGSERFRFPAMPYLYVLSGPVISRIPWLASWSRR